MAIVMKSLLLMNNLVYTVKLRLKSMVLHLAYYLQRSQKYYRWGLKWVGCSIAPQARFLLRLLMIFLTSIIDSTQPL